MLPLAAAKRLAEGADEREVEEEDAAVAVAKIRTEDTDDMQRQLESIANW